MSSMLLSTMAIHTLSPMRDASALTVGVENIPTLTFVSTLLALFSSVPVGWLFEAPDPKRRLIFSRVGLTRGETVGTSLALFYRLFICVLIFFSLAFQLLGNRKEVHAMFYLSVHLLKLHTISLTWGVAQEAMELEEENLERNGGGVTPSGSRLKRLGFVAFGGTLGGILGSLTTALYADTFHFTGLLLSSALLLEISARLSIYIGRIMKFYWSLGVKVRSEDDLQSLDSCLKRSDSSNNFRTMKKVSSGNSLNEMNHLPSKKSPEKEPLQPTPTLPMEADSFKARLLRGLTTILSSNLLITIFTYNALYASTTTLLSFHRAELVAKRDYTVDETTSFLASINMFSSAAVLCMQVTGGGANLARSLGVRGTLALMPMVRLVCVIALFVWKIWLKRPVGLWLFIVLDESTRIINLSVAKPVRESLWRGLSNEARYEAKPLVDTVANRWGGGSAAFLVTVLTKIIGKQGVMGMCCGICAWWVGVAFNLGMVRRKIDEELERQNKDK